MRIKCLLGVLTDTEGVRCVSHRLSSISRVEGQEEREKVNPHSVLSRGLCVFVLDKEK